MIIWPTTTRSSPVDQNQRDMPDVKGSIPIVEDGESLRTRLLRVFTYRGAEPGRPRTDSRQALFQNGGKTVGHRSPDVRHGNGRGISMVCGTLSSGNEPRVNECLVGSSLPNLLGETSATVRTDYRRSQVRITHWAEMACARYSICLNKAVATQATAFRTTNVPKARTSQLRFRMASCAAPLLCDPQPHTRRGGNPGHRSIRLGGDRLAADRSCAGLPGISGSYRPWSGWFPLSCLWIPPL